MQAPDWYEAWCEEAFAAFTAKQQRMDEAYRLGSWLRYDYDAAACTLTFSDANGPRLVGDIQVLGSIGAGDWLWGWANAKLPPQSLEAANAVRAFGAENGVEELTCDVLHNDDPAELGWMLAAIAARIVNAEGVYSAPTEDGAVYLLIRSFKSVS